MKGGDSQARQIGTPLFVIPACCWANPPFKTLYKVTTVYDSMTTASISSTTQVEHPPPPPPPPPPPDPQRTAEARAAFTAHLTSIGNSHISSLESRVSDIHANSTTISKQENEVDKQTKKLAKEAGKHQKVADEAAGKLKELGDIQNWAEVLERDLLVLEETVRMGEEGWVTDDEEEEEEEAGEEGGDAGRVHGKGKSGERMDVPDGHGPG